MQNYSMDDCRIFFLWLIFKPKQSYWKHLHWLCSFLLGRIYSRSINGYIADRLGRKKVTYYSFGLAEICSLSFYLINDIYIKIFCYFYQLSVLLHASAFNVLFIYSAEMYPTNIRSLAISFFSLSNRFSAGTSPYLLNIFPNLMVIISLLSGVATVTTLFLPESIGYNPGKDVVEREDVWGKITKGKNNKEFEFN